MSVRMVNLATVAVGLILLLMIVGFSFGPSPRFIPAPAWVDMVQLPSAIAGGVLGAVFVGLLVRRIQLGLVPNNKRPSLLTVILLTILGIAICSYATSRTIVSYGAQILVDDARDPQTISSVIASRYSSRRSGDGWRLAYGHRLPMPLQNWLNCVSIGSQIEISGQGNSFGLFFDKFIISDRIHSDQLMFDFVRESGQIPERCVLADISSIVPEDSFVPPRRRSPICGQSSVISPQWITPDAPAPSLMVQHRAV